MNVTMNELGEEVTLSVIYVISMLILKIICEVMFCISLFYFILFFNKNDYITSFSTQRKKKIN
jgi:hypothetical protein